MTGYEAPKQVSGTQDFSELRFTFDYSRQTIAEQNEIIAKTLDTVQHVNPEELPIGLIERKNNVASTTLNHRITFDQPVLNPGLRVENGIAQGFPQLENPSPYNENACKSANYTDHFIEIGAHIFAAGLIGTVGYGAYALSSVIDSNLISTPLVAIATLSATAILLNLYFVGTEIKKIFSESTTLRG